MTGQDEVRAGLVGILAAGVLREIGESIPLSEAARGDLYRSLSDLDGPCEHALRRWRNGSAGFLIFKDHQDGTRVRVSKFPPQEDAGSFAVDLDQLLRRLNEESKPDPEQ